MIGVFRGSTSPQTKQVTPSRHLPVWAIRRTRFAFPHSLIHRNTTAPTASSAPYFCCSRSHSAAPAAALPRRWPPSAFGPLLAATGARGSASRTMLPRSLSNPSHMDNGKGSDGRLQLQKANGTEPNGAHSCNSEPGAAVVAATAVGPAVGLAVPLLPLVVRELPHAVAGRLVRRYKRFLADVQMGAGPEGRGSGAGMGAAVTAVAVEGHEAAASAGAGAGAGVVAVAGAAAADLEAVSAARAAVAAAAVAGAAVACGSGAARVAAVAVRAAAGGDGASGGSGDDGGTGVVTVHCPNTGPMTGLLDWWAGDGGRAGTRMISEESSTLLLAATTSLPRAQGRGACILMRHWLLYATPC